MNSCPNSSIDEYQITNGSSNVPLGTDPLFLSYFYVYLLAAFILRVNNTAPPNSINTAAATIDITVADIAAP